MSTTNLPFETVTVTVPVARLRAALVGAKRHAARYGDSRKAVYVVAGPNDGLRVVAGDGDGTVSATVPATLPVHDGTTVAVIVDAATFSTALKGTRGDVAVTVTDNGVTVHNGPANVTVPAAADPADPVPATFLHAFRHTTGTQIVPAERLVTFRKYAAAANTDRPNLRHLFLTGEQMFCTDSYRLAHAADDGTVWPEAAIDPNGTVATIAERGGYSDVFLSVDADAGKWHADCGDWLAWGNVARIDIPMVQKMVDDAHHSAAGEWKPVDGLAGVCATLAKLGSEHAPVTFTVDNGTVTLSHPAMPDGMPAGTVHNVPDGTRWALNPAYAATILAEMGDRTVRLAGQSTTIGGGKSILKPLLWERQDNGGDIIETRLLMPVRVS